MIDAVSQITAKRKQHHCARSRGTTDSPPDEQAKTPCAWFRMHEHNATGKSCDACTTFLTDGNVNGNYFIGHPVLIIIQKFVGYARQLWYSILYV
jgi:hypothetical protein